MVSAPLWDSKASKFAGLLTTSDYINVIQYYFQNPAALDQIDQFRLDSLRGMLSSFTSHLNCHLWLHTDPSGNAYRGGKGIGRRTTRNHLD